MVNSMPFVRTQVCAQMLQPSRDFRNLQAVIAFRFARSEPLPVESFLAATTPEEEAISIAGGVATSCSEMDSERKVPAFQSCGGGAGPAVYLHACARHE